VVEPGDYGFWYEYRADAFRWNARLGFQAQPGPPPRPRGTVLMLHGWSLDALANLHWAVALAERGYRSVLMDLRNHGESGRAPAGLGMREADDVLALIAELRRQDRIEPPLVLLGVSLGAVTALETAAREPEVRGVLALEPFANGADAVQSAGTGLARLMTMHAVTERLATPERLDQVIDQLSHRLDLERALDPCRGRGREAPSLHRDRARPARPPDPGRIDPRARRGPGQRLAARAALGRPLSPRRRASICSRTRWRTGSPR
jgi:pimeloyl-ACP methyl ester carboxylesterase